jgi:hypothetical protein
LCTAEATRSVTALHSSISSAVKTRSRTSVISTRPIVSPRDTSGSMSSDRNPNPSSRATSLA